MNDQDIERSLSRFRLKTPSERMRTQVLGAAHATWKERREVKIPFAGSGLRWFIGYACAAALLILLNGAVSAWDSMQMAKILTPGTTGQFIDPGMNDIYAEVGRNHELIQRFSQMAQPSGDVGSAMVSWKQRQEKLRALGLDV